MDPQALQEKARQLSEQASDLALSAEEMAAETARLTAQTAQQVSGGIDPTIVGITVLVLACFVGYYVVWKVTPALHSPLMSVTNAISSVIIVGALIAVGPADFSFAKMMGFLAATLAAVNIFGGFIVTQRMLQMFKKKK